MHERIEGIEELRIAIIGPGAIASWHAEIIRNFGGSICGIAGPNPEDLFSFAHRHNVPATYKNVERLLVECQPHAVVVSSPTPLHAEHTLRSLTHGAHVLCEIPAADNLDDAERVAELARQSERNVAIAHTLRFWTPHREVRRRVENGGLDIKHLSIRSLQLRQSDHGWTGKQRDWTDNVLWHHGAHVVDAALWFLDTNSFRVSGSLGPVWERSGTEMDVSISIRSASGSLASLVLSYHSRVPASDYLIIAPDQTLQIKDGSLLDADGTSLLATSGDIPTEQRAAVARQDRQFFQCIIDGTRPQFLVEDALSTIRVLQSLQDAQSGRT